MRAELSRIYKKYPKVKEEADAQFVELIGKEVGISV